MQGVHEGAPQKQKWWVLAKARQGFRQLQKLNLAFQDWTERFWKASAAIAVCVVHSLRRPHPTNACIFEYPSLQIQNYSRIALDVEHGAPL